MSLRDVAVLLRPWQWSKNLILFAGMVFSLHLADSEYLVRSVAAFLVFCTASSAIYVLNDLFDVERDRRHPEKANRPIAAGRISVRAAGVIATVLVVVAGAAGYRIGMQFLQVLACFFVINFAYSFRLKNVVLLDVMTLAGSFVLRAVAGVAALRPLDANLEISPWLLVCTMFLALFLGLGKRRHELALLESGASGHRPSLGDYSPKFLDQLITIVSAGTLIAYAIYTIAPGTVSKFHSPWLILTFPFVAYGVFRYLFLMQARSGGGNPSRTLYRDLPILLTCAGWMATVIVVIYVNRP